MTASTPDDAALPDGVTPLTDGDPRVLGTHRVLGRLGQGGMGLVYLGRAPDGRPVAIKVVRPQFAADPEFRTRFRREAEAARLVRSEFTADLVDADLGGDAPWLATEYVPGPTLSAAVAVGGPLPEADVRTLIGHLALALRDVHAAGLVHRDLKPANVLLGPDGPRVIDMGIARAADATSLTMTGMQLGTPVFMAPEQARVDEPTPATDVWALGAVAFFAATGRRPFGDARPDIMYYRVVHEEPQLDDCPPWLRPFVEACLTKDPAARPTVDEIVAARPGLPGPRRAPAPAPDVPRAHAAPAAPTRRRGSLVAGVVAACSVVAGAGVAAAMTLLDGGDPPGTAETSTPTPASSRTPTDTPSPSTSADVEAQAGGGTATDGAVDPCLVGRWEQTSMADSWNLAGLPVDVTGWDGRVLQIDSSGVETVDYDDADPVLGDSAAGELVDTWTGTARYTFTTSDGTMRFEDVDNSGVSVDRELAGATETYTPPSVPAADVTYECDESTHTQQATTGAYEATFRRLAD